MDKILVSTDIGSDIDDALSIQAMFNLELPVEAIYTTNSADLKFRSYIAKHMVNLSGRNIAVCQGEARALFDLVTPYWYHEDCYYDNSFIDIEASKCERETQFKRLEDAGIIEKGVEDLVERLSRGSYVIFSLAPLTNIARIVRDYKDCIKNIKHLYIMGGSITGSQEHNFRHDIDAAEIVLNSDIPITVIPKELCDRYHMPVDFISRLSSPVGLYVKRTAEGFIAAKIAREFASNDVEYMVKEELRESFAVVTEENKDRIARKRREKDDLLKNLNDSYFGAFKPEAYFIKYKKLIEHLRDPELRHRRGDLMAKILEMIVPKELSVADVFVPYYCSNPGKCTVIRGKIKITNFEGVSILEEGDKHSVVVNVDFQDFERFLRGNLA